MIDDWLASIDHADFADWITVAAYLVAAMLSARSANRAWLWRMPRDQAFWQITAALLVFLGINELLDLQTLLTSIGREHAKTHGWYGEHRRVQFLFIIALGVLALVSGTVMLWLTRRTHPAVRLALAGLVFIGAFVFVRAASFHHADDILGYGPSQFNLGSMQEMAGILIVAAAASLYKRKRVSKRRSY